MKDRLFSDRPFYAKLKRLTIPIALQSLMLAAVAALGAALPFFNTIAVLLPLLFPRIVISLFALKQNREA